MSTTLERLQLALPAGQSIATLTTEQEHLLLDRATALNAKVEAQVAAIIADVRSNGDAALHEYARRYDGVELAGLEVPRARWDDALRALDPLVGSALQQAAAAIRAFHAAQMPQPIELETQRGVVLGRRTEALRRVGVYAPGGRAAYPSSVLMGVVPARVAGVQEIIVTSPPGPDGLPPLPVLAACALAGADRVFALGGAGAVAALALGTRTVPRVDKIVGPGNAYVTEAKRQLTGQVAIDSPAGPSEILVLADESADPTLIALELLAQAEHDADAACVLACTSARVIEQVAGILAQELQRAARRDVSARALAANGALLQAADEAELLGFAERYAPEHLLVLTCEPRSLLNRVRAAGTVFLGAGSSVAFGDYITGANHVLPTAGLSRAWAGLSTSDFLRAFTYQEVDARAAAALAAPTAALASAEGLPAHARAAEARSVVPGLAARAQPPLRAAYRRVELYDPQRTPTEVDLSDNTNLFGVPPAAAAFFASIPAARITRYPSVFASELKEAVADWFGVPPANVTTGCGSDDVIDSAVRAFCEPGDRLVLAEPTFSVVPTFARMNAAEPLGIALTPSFDLDVAGLVRARGRLTYVCRPNNPTGTVFPRPQIEALADEVPGILLLDEAYADFSDDDFTREAALSDRIISLRTFSKAFGLAGLRLGFAIGPAALIRELEKSRGPYKVNAIAEAVAANVLRADADWVRSGVEQVRTNRARLVAELEARGFRCFPSGGNFVLLAVPAGHSAVTLAADLKRRGVAVRPFPRLTHIGDALRVTIGPWPLLERFLVELEAS